MSPHSAADSGARGLASPFATRFGAARILAILVFALAAQFNAGLAAGAPKTPRPQPSMLDRLQPGEALFVPAESVKRKTGEVRVVRARLPEVIAFAWDTSQSDLIFEVDLNHGKYFHAAARPKDGQVRTGKKMLRELIEKRFDIKVEKGTKTAAVLILGRAEGAAALEPSVAKRSSVKAEPGRIIARRVAIQRLVRLLRDRLQATIVDETNLTDRYDFVLAWDPNSMPNSLMDALNDLGLRLSSGTRTVPVLTVRSAKKESPKSEMPEPNVQQP